MWRCETTTKYFFVCLWLCESAVYIFILLSRFQFELALSDLARVELRKAKYFLELPPYTRAGFDLTTQSSNLLGGRRALKKMNKICKKFAISVQPNRKTKK
jgi:hypothetical protein